MIRLLELELANDERNLREILETELAYDKMN
jgi:hypothetical protein